jgi:crossover junction endodeoxyribonuclease RuvC
MVTIGIDPSICSTGVAVCGKAKEEWTVFKTKRNGDLPMDELRRLIEVVTRIELFCIEHSPKLVVMEALAMSSRHSSALTQLSGLNYMIRERLYKRGIKIVVVAPSTLKKFTTGKGNCPKDLMLLEVYKRWGVSITDDNAADGYALAKLGQMLLTKKADNKQQQEVIDLLKKQL